MEVYKSIKGKDIHVDEQTEFESIESILKQRLHTEDLTESSPGKLLDPYLMKDMQ